MPRTNHTLFNSRSGLTRNLRHMIDETDRLLQSATASGDQAVEAVRESFVSQVSQMRDQLDDLEVAALDRTKRVARAANHSVHEHPYGAMGVAAAAGLLIGFLVARR